MEEVQLLSLWASPYVVRVKVALALKRIPYQIIEQDLQHKSELLLSSNPVHKKVPVLIHNQNSISESLLIVEYIDEAWPEDESRPGFFPKDPYGRAMARFWADFVDNKMSDPVRKLMQGKKEEAQREFLECTKIVDVALSQTEGPFFGGKTLGFADIIMAPSVAWKPLLNQVYGLEFPSQEECPYLYKWFVAIKEEPSVQAALPDVNKLVEYAKTRFSARPQ